MNTTVNSNASSDNKATSSSWWIWAVGIIVVVIAANGGFGRSKSRPTVMTRPIYYGGPVSSPYQQQQSQPSSNDSYSRRAAEREIEATYRAAQNKTWQEYLNYQRQRREEDARRDPNPYD